MGSRIQRSKLELSSGFDEHRMFVIVFLLAN
jgi:hypothetical protein